MKDWLPDYRNPSLFDVKYVPGKLEAVSYKDGEILSRDTLETTGAAKKIQLHPEKTTLTADGHSAVYVGIELVDEEGRHVPDEDIKVTGSIVTTANCENSVSDGLAKTAETSARSAAYLAAFGSANPVTAENYTKGNILPPIRVMQWRLSVAVMQQEAAH